MLRNDVAWSVLAEGSAVDPGEIQLFYTRRITPAANRASGDDQAENDYWNREHVWPQSYGLKGNNARTDVHNLVPVDRPVNSSRANRFFDEAGTPHHECLLCRVSCEAWEPAPEVRTGRRCANRLLHNVRYEGANTDAVPDLALTVTVDAEAARFGRLSTLMRWHCSDLVSAEEVQRHEAAAKAQGNRNAFVDSSALAANVYGFGCDEG